MKKSTLNLIASLIFLAGVIIGFYSVWSSSAKSGTATSESFVTLDISGVKEEAASLVAGRENNASIPLPVPTSKMGKTNPFSSPE